MRKTFLTILVVSWLAVELTPATFADDHPPLAKAPFKNAIKVTQGEPAKVKFHVELITDTAGNKLAGVRSCWGFNQSNIVRHGDNLYAMCWRADKRLVVFRRVGEGQWKSSPLLSAVPQCGVLMADSQGRVHVITGDRASSHVIFDPPGQVQKYSIQRLAKAETRFGASIRPNGDILVAGGGHQDMSWYVLGASKGYRPVASGRLAHKKRRAYFFVVFDGLSGHTFSYDDYSGPGGYHTLKTYYYYNPNVLKSPTDWQRTVISDVSDSVKGNARGWTENEDLLIDHDGRVHFLYSQNRQPVIDGWSMLSTAPATNEIYHVVGKPGGPLKHYLLGNFSRGRLYQTPDGRIHYLLCRGRWWNFDLYYAVSEKDRPQVISKPIKLKTPGKIDHVFVNSSRVGGTIQQTHIDCYFTGPYPYKTNRVWYGRLDP